MGCYETQWGCIEIVCEDHCIVRVQFCTAACADIAQGTEKECLEQIQEYLAGKRKVFAVPMRARGSRFQERVWEELLRIPYGQTASYRQIAERIGSPGAARAVGAACSRNPLWLLIPCHRVVKADGSSGGYAGGEAMKARLLALEKKNKPR